MSTALIGYTGFVGGNLHTQAHFDYFYHSKNIHEIRGMSFDLVLCAGAPAAKWKANQQPQGDYENIRFLMGNLQEIQAKKFLLISTVDVYFDPLEVDENTPVETSRLEPYGRHRFMLEEFVRERFAEARIVRLPGLYGTGLKKNIIYDLLHQNALHMTHYQSEFQFYNLDWLWEDLQVVLRHALPLSNFSVEPISVEEMAKACFEIEFKNVTEKAPVHYDMHTRLGSYFGVEGPYLYDKAQVIAGIRQFVQKEAQKGQ